MNIKFLRNLSSVVLAMMVLFTACKDDDSWKDELAAIEARVTANEAAITALEGLVGSGNWVTSVVSTTDGIVVTDNTGSTNTIALDAAAPVVTVSSVVSEDGSSVAITVDVDGVPSTTTVDFPAGVADLDISLSDAKDKLVVTIDGETTELDLPVDTNTYSVVVDNEDSWDLTIVDADGVEQTVTLPKNPVVITGIEFMSEVADIYGDPLELELNWGISYESGDVYACDDSEMEVADVVGGEDRLLPAVNEAKFRVSPSNVVIDYDALNADDTAVDFVVRDVANLMSAAGESADGYYMDVVEVYHADGDDDNVITVKYKASVCGDVDEYHNGADGFQTPVATLMVKNPQGDNYIYSEEIGLTSDNIYDFVYEDPSIEWAGAEVIGTDFPSDQLIATYPQLDNQDNDPDAVVLYTSSVDLKTLVMAAADNTSFEDLNVEDYVFTFDLTDSEYFDLNADGCTLEPVAQNSTIYNMAEVVVKLWDTSCTEPVFITCTTIYIAAVDEIVEPRDPVTIEVDYETITVEFAGICEESNDFTFSSNFDTVYDGAVDLDSDEFFEEYITEGSEVVIALTDLDGTSVYTRTAELNTESDSYEAYVDNASLKMTIDRTNDIPTFQFFDVTVPFGVPAGTYPLTATFTNDFGDKVVATWSIVVEYPEVELNRIAAYWNGDFVTLNGDYNWDVTTFDFENNILDAYDIAAFEAAYGSTCLEIHVEIKDINEDIYTHASPTNHAVDYYNHIVKINNYAKFNEGDLHLVDRDVAEYNTADTYFLPKDGAHEFTQETTTEQYFGKVTIVHATTGVELYSEDIEFGFQDPFETIAVDQDMLTVQEDVTETTLDLTGIVTATSRGGYDIISDDADANYKNAEKPAWTDLFLADYTTIFGEVVTLELDLTDATTAQYKANGKISIEDGITFVYDSSENQLTEKVEFAVKIVFTHKWSKTWGDVIFNETITVMPTVQTAD